MKRPIVRWLVMWEYYSECSKGWLQDEKAHLCRQDGRVEARALRTSGVFSNVRGPIKLVEARK